MSSVKSSVFSTSMYQKSDKLLLVSVKASGMVMVTEKINEFKDHKLADRLAVYSGLQNLERQCVSCHCIKYNFYMYYYWPIEYIVRTNYQ